MDEPHVSICMPYFNRIKPLLKTLRMYEDHGYFEHKHIRVNVCICDDGSMYEPAAKGTPEFPWLKIKTLPKKPQWASPSLAINIAATMSKSPLILLTSPEIYHPAPVLWEMVKQIKSIHDSVLAPTLAEKRNEDRTIRKQWVGHPVHRPAKYWWCQLLSRHLFEKVGGFDIRYTDSGKLGWDDDDFCERLNEANVNWKWLDDQYHVVHGMTPHRVSRSGTNKKLFKRIWGKDDTRDGIL